MPISLCVCSERRQSRVGLAVGDRGGRVARALGAVHRLQVAEPEAEIGHGLGGSPAADRRASSSPERCTSLAPAFGLTHTQSISGFTGSVPLVSMATSKPPWCSAATSASSTCSIGSPVRTTNRRSPRPATPPRSPRRARGRGEPAAAWPVDADEVRIAEPAGGSTDPAPGRTTGCSRRSGRTRPAGPRSRPRPGACRKSPSPRTCAWRRAAGAALQGVSRPRRRDRDVLDGDLQFPRRLVRGEPRRRCADRGRARAVRKERLQEGDRAQDHRRQVCRCGGHGTLSQPLLVCGVVPGAQRQSAARGGRSPIPMPYAFDRTGA